MTTAGVEQPFFGIEGDGLVITHPDSIEESKFLGRSDRGQLAIPVYLLTSTGEAVASILDYDPVAIADRLWRGLQQSIREGAINRYRLLHGRWVQIGSLKAMTPNDSFGGPNTFGGFNTPGSI